LERIVECVPNFSEGRKLEVVASLVEAVESVEGAGRSGHARRLGSQPLGRHFVAPPEAIVEAAVRVVARAAELIDLRAHAGVHPRMGACDVLPFVPVRGSR
jgi:glutamate formiminotransferase